MKINNILPITNSCVLTKVHDSASFKVDLLHSGPSLLVPYQRILLRFGCEVRLDVRTAKDHQRSTECKFSFEQLLFRQNSFDLKLHNYI